jgi:small subunit ribosomal protein S6
MRTYELMFVVDPRVSDEEVTTLTHDYRQMIVAGGSEITKEENWGRRKLAYPIEKLTEGKYVVFYVSSEGGKTSLPEVEHRMRQNDKILRFLTVRTDLDLKRAGSRVAPLEAPVQPGAAPVAAPGAPGAPVPAAVPAAPQPEASGAGRGA